MYTNNLGRELYSKVEKLVDRAFHRIYLYSEVNSFSILDIKLDYTFVDEEGDIPIVNVRVGCSTGFDGDFNVELEYNLEESDDYNVGFFVKTFHDCLDKAD